MKKYLTLVAILINNFLMVAQTDKTPKTAFTKMYLDVWIEATAHCMEVAKTMPEELYDYRPTPISKTFAEQMVHIAASTPLLTKRYVEGKEVTPHTPDAHSMSKAEILAFLQKGFDYTTEIIYTIDQKQLDEKCKMYHSNNVVSRAFALFYVQDHLANHRAKANLYIRMNNINPPEYTW